MRQIKPSTFIVGFLIASLTALIVWYYQKSTSVEDGALDLLDRYAQTQTRVQELERQLSRSAIPEAVTTPSEPTERQDRPRPATGRSQTAQ
jgi:hypothetical protein